SLGLGAPFAIQTGAFGVPANAERRLALLRANGFDGAFSARQGRLQVVYAGGYDDRLSAAADLRRVRSVVGEAFVTVQ
ncbi:MAG: SPOR domain-containing protein, partial [Pseudomonadota bacterium]